MKREIKCLNCGSKNLILHQEFLLIKKKRILRDGRVSKKSFETYLDDYIGGLNTDSIDCLDCKKEHYFELDDNNKIVKIGMLD